MARKDFFFFSRKLRRKRLILKALVVGVIFAAIFAGVVAFFRIPYLQVEKIEISGNNLINRDGLIKKIKKISLDKKYFGAIVVKLEERSNAVLFCEKEDCAYADENGFVFEKAPYFSGAVFLKLIEQRNSDSGGNAKTIDEYLGTSLIAENEFKKILEFAGLPRPDSVRLAAKTGGGVSEVVLKKENIYEFYMNEGWKIILNDKNEPQSAYLNLITALEANIKDKRPKLDYIDLRLGNKIYFKYK